MKIRLTRQGTRTLDEWGDRLGAARPQRKTILNAIIHTYSFQAEHVCSAIQFDERLPYPTGYVYKLSTESEKLLDGLLSHANGKMKGRALNAEELANYLVSLFAVFKIQLFLKTDHVAPSPS